MSEWIVVILVILVVVLLAGLIARTIAAPDRSPGVRSGTPGHSAEALRGTG
jgi:hypothetical protein